MANDKNFKIKNGLSAKRYLLNGSTLSGSTIDLSLASVFSTTLSSDPAYTFTNPPPSGTAAAFSVEVTGGTTTFTNDAFATTLYAGNGSTQTITNGLDLSGDGGLVWMQVRDVTGGNRLVDSENGNNYLRTHNGSGLTGIGSPAFTLNSNGFTVPNGATAWNGSGNDIVSWAFKKQAKFFDVVTWTGDGVSGRTISHSLNSEVGFFVVKGTDASAYWRTYHRVSASSTHPNIAYLNGTSGGAFESDKLTATSTTFTIEGGFNGDFNSPGHTYVAYLFGHDTSDDSIIKCGSYIKTGSSQDIDLGWSPEWLMLKRVRINGAPSSGAWYIMDTKRGFTTNAQAVTLKANAVDAEGGLGNVRRTSTGFNVTSNAGEEWLYMAIRASEATDSAITWPSSVKWPSGLAPTTPAPGTKDLFTFLTTDGGTTYYGKKAGSDIA